MKKSYLTLVSALFLATLAFAQPKPAPKPAPKQTPKGGSTQPSNQPRVNTMNSGESANKEYRTIEVFTKYADASQLHHVEQSGDVVILPGEKTVVQHLISTGKSTLRIIDISNEKGTQTDFPTNYIVTAIYSFNSDHVLLETENGFVLFQVSKQSYATKLFGTGKRFIGANNKEAFFYSNHGDFSQFYSIELGNMRIDEAVTDSKFKTLGKTAYEVSNVFDYNGEPIAATYLKGGFRYLARLNNYQLETISYTIPIDASFTPMGCNLSRELFFNSNKDNHVESLYKLNAKNEIEVLSFGAKIGVERINRIFVKSGSFTPYFYTLPTYSTSSQILTESNSLKAILSRKESRISSFKSSIDGNTEIFLLSSDDLPYELFIFKNGQLVYENKPSITQFSFAKSSEIVDMQDKSFKQSARLFLPNGTSSSKYPLALVITDDPFNYTCQDFNFLAQSLVSRGFAVLLWNSPLAYQASGKLFDLTTLPKYATSMINEVMKKGVIAANDLFCIGVGKGAYHAIYASSGEKTIFKKTFLVSAEFANAIPNITPYNAKQIIAATGGSIITIDKLSFAPTTKFAMIADEATEDVKKLTQELSLEAEVDATLIGRSDSANPIPLYARVTRSATEEARVRVKLLPTK